MEDKISKEIKDKSKCLLFYKYLEERGDYLEGRCWCGSQIIIQKNDERMQQDRFASVLENLDIKMIDIKCDKCGQMIEFYQTDDPLRWVGVKFKDGKPNRELCIMKFE